MNNTIYLSLSENSTDIAREPVADANDLRYAAARLWTTLDANALSRRKHLWLDLVYENGTPLTKEERDDFLLFCPPDCEIAFGYVCPTATIILDADADAINDIISNIKAPDGVGVYVNHGHIQIDADILFTSYPNRHLKYYQYTYIDKDAVNACQDMMNPINATADEIIAALEAAGVEIFEIYMANSERIDIRYKISGDYVAVDLGDLSSGFISFNNP